MAQTAQKHLKRRLFIQKYPGLQIRRFLEDFGRFFDQKTSGLYYNRAMIVTQISWIILIIFKLLNVTTNDIAYLGYDRSYDRNTVIVQATGPDPINEA